MRHTNGNETGGAPWTTPSASDDSLRENRYAQGGNPLTMQTGQAQWPTPMAGTPAQNGNNYAGNNDSSRRFETILGLRETPNGPKSQWPTPVAVDVVKGDGYAAKMELPRSERGGGCSPNLATTLSQWPTPTVADIEGGRKARSGDRAGEMLLNGLMAGWATPTIADIRKGAPTTKWEKNGAPLVQQMTSAAWSTPRASDGEKGGPNMSFGAGGTPLPAQMAHSGPAPNGSSAPTEKRGAPNPEFACWLMGWPDALTSGALQAIQSFRKSRPKSSGRSKTSSPKFDLFG